jgi:Cu2+-exporting ATPase
MSVTGGSINAESPLVVQIEQVGEGHALSAIIQLMERAAAEKPRIVEMADRIASYFVAALLGGRDLVAIGWYLVDPSKALWITVSVLVVTCPCALSLATPIALTVAGRGAGQGWLAGHRVARHRNAGPGHAFRF